MECIKKCSDFAGIVWSSETALKYVFAAKGLRSGLESK